MIELTGLAGKAALIAPIVVLLIVVWRTVRRPAPPDPHPHPHRESSDQPAQPVAAEPLGIASPAVIAKPAPLPEKPPAESETEKYQPVEPQPAVAPEPTLPLSPLADWPTRIADAEARDDKAALAAAYLSYARAQIASGNTSSAADQLRACIQFAFSIRDRAMQAEARLELAEIARAAGDLTTACEHWQIARGVFHELRSKDDLGKTEELMRTHGCPTDWVLNDF